MMQRQMSQLSTALPLAIIAISLVACSRPAAVKNAGASQADQRAVPFHDSDQSSATSASAPFQGSGKISTAKSALPLSDQRSATLPAGTLLTVRLENPISAGRDAHGVFSAVVAEPVIVEGNVLVPRGAEVLGRIESSNLAGAKGNRCCVRLTLDAIDLSGKELPIQTSTLFAHNGGFEPNGSPSKASPQGVRLKTGHRLTFRLAEATYVASQQPSPR
jgi:hypothetical protein